MECTVFEKKKIRNFLIQSIQFRVHFHFKNSSFADRKHEKRRNSEIYSVLMRKLQERHTKSEFCRIWSLIYLSYKTWLNKIVCLLSHKQTLKAVWILEFFTKRNKISKDAHIYCVRFWVPHNKRTFMTQYLEYVFGIII